MSFSSAFIRKGFLTLLTVVLFAVLVLPTVNANAEEDDPNAPVGTMTVTDSKTRTTNTTGSGGNLTHDWVRGVNNGPSDGDEPVTNDGDDNNEFNDCNELLDLRAEAVDELSGSMYLYRASGRAYFYDSSGKRISFDEALKDPNSTVEVNILSDYPSAVSWAAERKSYYQSMLDKIHALQADYEDCTEENFEPSVEGPK